MAKKSARHISRQDLADLLATLSRQVRDGQLEVEGHFFPVPEEVDLKFHLKEEKGAVVVKLSCGWSPQGTRRPDTAAPIRPQPASLKTVKIRLAAGFKDLQRTLGQGSFPEAQALADFVASSQAFAALAAPAWQEAMTRFMAHLEDFRQAWESRQLQAMQQALQALTASMVACHRDFK